MEQHVEGDRVRHVFSGWAGHVAEIHDTDGGMGQGLLVTVKPDHPRPGDAADDWTGWKPITVTMAELERVSS